MGIFFLLVLLFLCVAVLVVLHVCIVGTSFQRPGSEIAVRRESNEGDKGKEVISHDDLTKLPCLRYKESTDRGESWECVVCLESFGDDDECRVLPNCGHIFHVECVDSWLLKSPNCPICRANVKLVEIEEGIQEDQG